MWPVCTACSHSLSGLASVFHLTYTFTCAVPPVALCLYDIRPKPSTCPRQRWEKSETNKMEGVHSLTLKKKPLLFLVMEHFTATIHTYVVRLSVG